jgi:hypothetical protein
MKLTATRLIGSAFFFLLSNSTFAQANVCGDPPPVANETLKGEINGKAQIVSKYLGDAQLSGKIETSRTEIFSKYADGETSRANAYFEYQVCILLFADKKMTTQEKLEELRKVRREFKKPTVKKVSIIIRPSGPVYDNSDIGGVSGSRSTVELRINGESVVEHRLNSSFGSHEVEVSEGVNKFEFIVDVKAEDAEIRSNCVGQFTVTGPASYQPRVIFKRSQGAPGKGRITGCQLIRLSMQSASREKV